MTLKKREKLNLSLDPQEILKLIDFKFDKIQKDKNYIRSFCPIHKETHIRTLKIDLANKTFKCSFKNCPGYKGGDLLDLISLSLNIPLPKVLSILHEKLKVEIDPSLLFKTEKDYFNTIEESINNKDFQTGIELIKLLRETPFYKKIKVKERILSYLVELEDKELSRQVIQDIWKEFTKKKQIGSLLRIIEKYYTSLFSFEDFDKLINLLKKYELEDKLLIWEKRKIRFFAQQYGKNEDYYNLLRDMIIQYKHSPDLELSLEYFEYLLENPQANIEEIKDLAYSIIPIVEKNRDFKLLNDIKKILFSLNLIPYEEYLSYLSSRIKKDKKIDIEELLNLFKFLGENPEVYVEEFEKFIRENYKIIVDILSLPQIDLFLKNIKSHNLFSHDEKTKRIILNEIYKKILQDKNNKLIYSITKSILNIEKDKKILHDFLLLSIETSLKNNDIEESFHFVENFLKIIPAISKTYSERKKIFSKFLNKTINTSSFIIENTCKILSYYNKNEAIEIIFEYLPKFKDFAVKRKLLEKIITDLNIVTEEILKEYLNSILKSKLPENYLDEFSIVAQAFKNFMDKREINELLVKIYNEKFSKNQTFIEIIIDLIQGLPLEKNHLFWIKEYLYNTDPSLAPMNFIELSIKFFDFEFDEKIFSKCLNALNYLSDPSFFKNTIKKAIKYFINKKKIKEIYELFTRYKHYDIINENDFLQILNLFFEDKKEEFFIEFFIYGAENFPSKIKECSAKIIKYVVDLFEKEKLKDILNILYINNAIDSANLIIHTLLEETSPNKYSYEEIINIIPAPLINKELEDKYIKSLKKKNKIADIVKFYQKKVDKFLEKKDWQNAKKYLDKITKITPDDLKVVKLNAEIEEKLGKIKNAIKHYEKLLNIYLKDNLYNDALNIIEKILLSVSEPDEKIKYLEKKIEIKKSNNITKDLTSDLYLLATLYEEKGDIEKSITLFEKVWEFSNKSHLKAAKKLFKYAYINQNKENLNRYLKEILLLLKNDSESKLKFLKLALKIDKENFEILEKIGDIYISQGKLKEGLKYLRMAANSTIKQKLYTQTIKIYEKITKMNPETITFHSRLGKLYSKLKKNDESLSHYFKAAQICYQKNRINDAIHLLKVALQENPFDFKVAEYLAELYTKNNRKSQAFPIYISIGENLEITEQYREAIKYYKKALKLNPEHIGLIKKLIALGIKLNDVKLTDTFLNKFLKILQTRQLKEKDILIVEKILKKYKETFGINEEFWTKVSSFIIHSEYKKFAKILFEELISYYYQQNLLSNLVKTGSIYISKYEPSPETLKIYLLSIYKFDRKLFYEQYENYRKLQSNEIKEILKNVLENLTQKEKLDVKLYDYYIELLLSLNKTEIAQKNIIKIWQEILNAEKFEDFEKYAQKYLPIIENNYQLLEKILPYYQKIDEEKYKFLSIKCANLALKENNIFLATEIFNQLTQKYPLEIEPHLKLIEIYEKAGDDISLYNEITLTAEIYIKRNQIEHAVKLLEKLLPDLEIEKEIINIYVKSENIQKALEKIYEYADLAVEKEKNYEKALSLLDLGKEIYPGKIETYKKIIYILENYLPENVEKLKEEYKHLASLYKETDALSGAKKYYEKALLISPDDLNIWKNYFSILQKLNTSKEVLKEKLQLALTKIENLNNSILLKIAREIFTLNDIKSLLVKHNFPTSFQNLYLQKITEKDIEEVILMLNELPLDLTAVEFSKKLLEKMLLFKSIPAHIEIQLKNLLDKYLTNGVFGGAILIYKILMKINEENTAYLEEYLQLAEQTGIGENMQSLSLKLAKLYIKHGKIEKGINYLKKLKNTYPENIEILETFVENYPMVGFEEEIINDYIKLAKLYENKNGEKAKEYWKKVSILSPDNEEAKKYLQK